MHLEFVFPEFGTNTQLYFLPRWCGFR